MAVKKEKKKTVNKPVETEIVEQGVTQVEDEDTSGWTTVVDKRAQKKQAKQSSDSSNADNTDNASTTSSANAAKKKSKAVPVEIVKHETVPVAVEQTEEKTLVIGTKQSLDTLQSTLDEISTNATPEVEDEWKTANPKAKKYFIFKIKIVFLVLILFRESEKGLMSRQSLNIKGFYDLKYKT